MTKVVVQKDPEVSINMLSDSLILKNKGKAPSFDSGTVNASDPKFFFEAHQYKSHGTSDAPRLKNAINLGTSKTDTNNLWNEWDKVSNQDHLNFYKNGTDEPMEKVLVVISNKPLKHFYKLKQNLKGPISITSSSSTQTPQNDVLPKEMIIVCNENFWTYSIYLAQFLCVQAILEAKVTYESTTEIVQIPTVKLESYEILKDFLVNYFKINERIQVYCKDKELQDSSVWELKDQYTAKQVNYSELLKIEVCMDLSK